MQFTKEQVDPCTVQLDVEIDSETVNRAFDRAYREFGSFTTVPGFRPGKAPRKILERYVNQEHLRERVMELVAAPAYRDILKQENITPYDDPQVEFSDLQEGQPWQFKAIVALPPKVTLGDYSNITVERPVYTITDQDVERAIEDTCREHARLVKVEGRGVQDGDWLIAETTVTLEGEEASTQPQRTLIRMGDNIPGFDEAILGLLPDEERTFTLTYPDDYQDAARRGKKATFTVKLVSIQERILPEVTEEWVRDVTGFSSLEEWKSHLREAMTQRLKKMADEVVEGRVIEQLLQRATIEFPGVMVHNEVEGDLHELMHELEERGLTYDQYLQANNLTAEQHRERLTQRAVHTVRVRLVIQELAKQENIRVTDAEINAEFQRLFRNSQYDEKTIKRMMQSEHRRRNVANLLLQRKLHDCLFRIATITDVPVSEGVAPAALET